MPKVLLAMILVLGLGIDTSNAQSSPASDPSVFGVFVGSSPCDGPIRQLLQIPSDAKADLIQWKLTLHQDPKTQAPSRYDLRFDYGSTAANKPGLAKEIKSGQRQGTWTMGKGTKSNSDAVVYELNGAVSLFQVDADILQVLNPDRSLMVGNGGWSYTLNRTDRAEIPTDAVLSRSQPDMSYVVAPRATGPAVFAIFGGRTPCQGIAREQKVSVHRACTKVKWSVTLFQNPETKAPTTYKVEGGFYLRAAREGNWTLIRGTPKDPNAVVYRLASAKAEPDLLLLKGDDNVLFFLDQDRNPRVGHSGHSYTLNRE